MRFHVPQFIGVEDKIFGPLSFKQFIYLAGGGGIVVVIWYFVESLFLTALLGLPIAAFAVALAFYELNGKPFIHTVEAFFKYIGKKRMYIWKKQPKDITDTPPPKQGAWIFHGNAQLAAPRMKNSKLKDLEWEVDVANKGEAKSTDAQQHTQRQTSEQYRS